MSIHIVENIVGRLHVATPDREVIREVIGALRGRGWKAKYRHYRSRSRSERHILLTLAIKAHYRNRKLYRDVMRGSFS